MGQTERQAHTHIHTHHASRWKMYEETAGNLNTNGSELYIYM